MIDLIEREEWLIRKSGFFYRPDCRGYTTIKAEAGRYTQAKAESEARIEPWHMAAIHQDDWPPDSLSARVEFYEHKLASAADRITTLEAELARSQASVVEAERRGMERAAEVADAMPWYRIETPAHVRSNQPKDVAAAIRSLISETPARDGWLPISSAPKNRAIQIHVPSLDYYGNGGVYAGMLVDMGTGPHWMTFGWAIGRDLGDENTPDAWRALPLPPSPDQREG